MIAHSPPCLACVQVGYYKSVIEGYERAALLQFNAMLPAPLEEEPPEEFSAAPITEYVDAASAASEGHGPSNATAKGRGGRGGKVTA